MKSRLIGCQNEFIIMIDLIKYSNAINPFAVENDSASLQCKSHSFTK